MNRIAKIGLVSIALVVLSMPAFGDPLSIPNTFTDGTIASAGQVNTNFAAVKTAVDDKIYKVPGSGLVLGGSLGSYTLGIATGGVTSAHIADGTITGADIANNTITSAKIADEPGVNWYESGSGGTISTTSAQLAAVSITAPASGYVIVTASGSIYWDIASAAQGMIRLKVSSTSADTGETPGVQFLRFQSGLGTGVFCFPFSITKVFSVASGTSTFYLNGWHQVANGTASLDDHTLVALFVPTKY